MIFSLPRYIEDLRREALVPEGNPYCRLSPIKNGLMIFNLQGKLVAQVLKWKGYYSVSVGDGGGVVVFPGKKGELNIKPVNEEGEEPKREMKRSFDELIFFGNYEKAHYEIFIKKPGQLKPVSLVRAVAHPLNERLVNVEVNDKENFLLAVALCMAMPH